MKKSEIQEITNEFQAVERGGLFTSGERSLTPLS
jgi:hypothetical protein